MAGPNEQPLPPDVIGREDATEVLRAFVVDGGLSIAFQRAFEEPDMWGMLLVDIARRRKAVRRGGVHVVRVPLDVVDLPASERDMDLIAIDHALEKLAAADSRKARVVELRFFGGSSMEEIASALDVSIRTVHSDWAFARAWLYRELSGRDRQ